MIFIVPSFLLDGFLPLRLFATINDLAILDDFLEWAGFLLFM